MSIRAELSSRLASVRFWKQVSLVLFTIAAIEFVCLVGFDDVFNFSNRASDSSSAKEEGFEAFEGITFARDFSERFLTFDSSNFRSRQTAVAFLLDDQAKSARLAEIDRLSEKIEKRDVSQRARLVTLTRVGDSEDRFRANVEVELIEGSGAGSHRSHFTTRLDFSIERTERNSQNTWGFRVGNLAQQVVPEETGLGTKPVFALRPGVPTLLRFPCSIENVELPKGTSVRVKLTTLDISELQLRTVKALEVEQTVRAVCRDRAFTLKLVPEGEISDGLVVLKTLKMESAVALPSAESLKAAARNRRKTGVEKSIEDQLGFVVEEE